VVVDGVLDAPHTRWRAGLPATMGRTGDGWARTMTGTMRRRAVAPTAAAGYGDDGQGRRWRWQRSARARAAAASGRLQRRRARAAPTTVDREARRARV
jgi:hypothetical protein